MSRENVELVRGLFEEWGRGNFWARPELYDPEVEWHWSGSGSALRGGDASYRGVAEVVAGMREWLGEWDRFRVNCQEFIDAGDQVVVVIQARAQLKGDRGEVRDQWADVITISDGRIVCLRAFDSRTEALEAVKLPE